MSFLLDIQIPFLLCPFSKERDETVKVEIFTCLGALVQQGAPYDAESE